MFANIAFIEQVDAGYGSQRWPVLLSAKLRLK